MVIEKEGVRPRAGAFLLRGVSTRAAFSATVTADRDAFLHTMKPLVGKSGAVGDAAVPRAFFTRKEKCPSCARAPILPSEGRCP